jgi:hypothetical protein
MAWTLANLRARFRTLTGRGTTGDISNADCNSFISDYYRYEFCLEMQLDRFDASYTVDLTATDSGEYTVSEDVLDIQGPIFCNDEEVGICPDKESFWRLYPSDEDWISAPTLVIGVVSAASVKNSAFNYMGSDGRVRTKAAAETALSGDDVPESKYGAWLLEIDDDGTIAVQEADDNATGYDTAALAIDGLPATSSDYIAMGFVTAISTSGAFTPGTTLLSAAAVTDTYTDGNPMLRGQPTTVLVNRSAGKLYVRPKPDDIYLLKSNATLQRPSALTTDSDTLYDEAWGPAVAVGAAIKYLAGQEGEDMKIAELDYGGGQFFNPSNPAPGSLQYELARIRAKEYRQQSERIIPRSF